MDDNSTPVLVKTHNEVFGYENATSFYVTKEGDLVIESGSKVIAIHRTWQSVCFAAELKES